VKKVARGTALFGDSVPYRGKKCRGKVTKIL